MDNRRFTRIAFSAPVQLRQGSQTWQSDLLDLSLHGLLISRPDQFEPNLELDLVVSFTLDGLPHPIVLVGKISHINSVSVGIMSELIDIDSISELRRVVELNMGDDALLNRNFEHLCQIDE